MGQGGVVCGVLLVSGGSRDSGDRGGGGSSGGARGVGDRGSGMLQVGGRGGRAERVDPERPARHVRLDTCNKIYKSVSPASL